MAKTAEASYMCVLCYACGEWERIVKNKDGSRWQGLIASPEYSNLEAFLMRHQQCPAEAITAELESLSQEEGGSLMKRKGLQEFNQSPKEKERFGEFKRFYNDRGKPSSRYISIHTGGRLWIADTVARDMKLQNKKAARLYCSQDKSQIGIEFLDEEVQGAFAVNRRNDTNGLLIPATDFLRYLGLYKKSRSKIPLKEVGDNYLIVDLNP